MFRLIVAKEGRPMFRLSWEPMFMSTSFDELDSLQSSTRISCTFNLNKDIYSLCHFAMASLLGVCGSAEAEEIQNAEDCLSALQGGLQVLSGILQKYLELPFVVPKYVFRVSIHAVKLFCILAANLETCLDGEGTRNKQFDPRRTAEMVKLNSKLLQYKKSDLRKAKNEKNSRCSTDMVTAFACFEPTNSGQGFSGCLLDVSSFPEGSYQIKWHTCCDGESCCGAMYS